MRPIRAVLVTIALALSTLSISLLLISEGASAYTPHDPIEINGDSEFTAANGVVGGSGTPSDPYIIEGWEINASIERGIYIRNTNAYFVIRDVYVHSGAQSFPPKQGIYLSNVVNARIENNSFSNNSLGLYLSDAINVTVTSNNFTSDGIGFEGYFSHMYASSHTISQDNLVNGKPVRYYKNCENLEIDGESVGQLIIANCTNVQVSNLQLNGTAYAISLYYVENATIEGNAVRNSFMGIRLSFTNNTTVMSNNLTLNMGGLSTGYSHNITVANCSISNNSYGGVILDHFDDVDLRNNSIEDSDFGIFFEQGDSIMILGNVIRDNELGIGFGSVGELLAYHNDFIDNLVQVYPYNGTGDLWDAGYPSGGNYWSDYVGIDNCSGPNQTVCPDADGIGDTPYPVDNNSQDRYPFIEPLHIEEEPPGNLRPECEIEHPEEGDRIHGVHVIEGTANDEDGEVILVEIRIGEGTWFQVEGTDSWSYEWDTENLTNGEYEIHARSFDGEDYSTEANITVEVHNPTAEEKTIGDVFFWVLLVMLIVIAVGGIALEVRRRKKD